MRLPFLVVLFASVTWATPAVAAPVELTVLHTNDTHDHLLPYDTPEAKSVGGVARRATLIQRLKATTPNVLVLDAGDTFQGTPLFNFFAGEPDFATLDECGYDATTVGNHDLDDGLPNLIKQDQNRHFALLSANLLEARSHLPIFPPFKLFTRGGLKIAVFGMLGDEAYDAVAKKAQAGTELVSPLKLTQPLVDGLRPQADLVVMLSHSGLDADLALAKQVKGIDLIIGGHSHTLVPHPIAVTNGAWHTYVVQDYDYGEYLGRLDLKLDLHRLTSVQGELLPITAAIPADPQVAATVASYEQRIEKEMAVSLGTAPQGLSDAGKYEGDCALGDWTADVLRQRTGADIGIMNAGGLRAPLLPGPVTVGGIFAIFPFENAVVTGELAGTTLQALVDRAAATPHQAGMLQYAGLTFHVADGRALDVRVGGTPLALSRRYTIATIDYLAAGNDRHVRFRDCPHYTPLGETEGRPGDRLALRPPLHAPGRNPARRRARDRQSQPHHPAARPGPHPAR